MHLNVRDVNFVYYRLFFIYLLFLCAVAGLATITLEFIGVRVIQLDLHESYDAYIATCWVAILISFTMASIMLQFIKERRKQSSDRRQQNIPIDFSDRRMRDRRS
ncbi:MAG: hypothetical protein OQK98_05210 [Gammaproteobacteria bacterium]|nr:hypothetical protein [Gammaproteobacteria bacterium]